jgi:hypothetical protein
MSRYRCHVAGAGFVVALASVVVGVALLAGVAGASSRRAAVTPIPWNSAKRGIPVLMVGRAGVWIEALTVTPGATTVWRVRSATARVQPTPIKANAQSGPQDLFPGPGTLWMSILPFESDGLRLDWVDIAHGFRLVPKAVPSACKQSDGGHSVVYGGRLWFTCSGFGVYVFTPTGSQPVQRIRLHGVNALLATSRGVWAAQRASIRAIAGPEKGAVVALPRGFVVAGDYASNAGWAVAGSAVWAIGLGRGGRTDLVRIDLRRRKSTAYPIVVPHGNSTLVGGIAAAGREIWFGDEGQPRLIRYSQAHPSRPFGYIALPGHGYPKHGLMLTGGAGAAWVSIEHPGGIRLFRVSIR